MVLLGAGVRRRSHFWWCLSERVAYSNSRPRVALRSTLVYHAFGVLLRSELLKLPYCRVFLTLTKHVRRFSAGT
jgi:hypothetical protein